VRFALEFTEDPRAFLTRAGGLLEADPVLGTVVASVAAAAVAALDRGERSRAALLAAVWDDVPIELLPMAAMAMEAHLEKLEREGRLPELRE